MVSHASYPAQDTDAWRGNNRIDFLPIGMLSEQADESRNKLWRYDREHYTQKLNRKTTDLDLFHRALESSDPFLSTISIGDRHKKKKRSVLPDKVLSLLKPTMDNVVIHDPLPESSADISNIECVTDDELN